MYYESIKNQYNDNYMTQDNRIEFFGLSLLDTEPAYFLLATWSQFHQHFLSAIAPIKKV
jgi:hypothetical protein